MSYTHIFAGNPLDRGDVERRDEQLLRDMVWQDNAKFLPFHKLNPLILKKQQAELAWINNEFLKEFPGGTSNRTFLGFDTERTPYFAVDVSRIENPSDILKFAEQVDFEDGRSAAASITNEQSGILAQARSNLNWHIQNRFCSVCGTESESQRGGLMRECHSSKPQHFPRTDPVAIMLVYKGEQCVMGQTLARSNSTFYSCLAGFMDQGESIEEGVRREVREESGLEVGKVTYHSSQPWPFPSSLMIGCHAEAISDEITSDPGEMSDVRWFTKEDVKLALEDKLDGVNIPGPIAIAHHLIKAWAYETNK